MALFHRETTDEDLVILQEETTKKLLSHENRSPFCFPEGFQMHSRVGTKPVIYGEEVRPQHFGSQADK